MMENVFHSSLSRSSSGGVGYLAVVLFAIELYHAFAHFCILFRVRMLPKRDLVRVRMYFLVDLLSVSACALYTREVLWLAALQNLQHAFFYFTWNKNWYCIRVIDWSSLEWKIKTLPDGEDNLSTKMVNKTDRVDVTLGTAFDMCVHLTYAYFLAKSLSALWLLGALGLTVVAAKMVLFNTRFSWSNPAQVPKWVARRIINIDATCTKSK